ASSRVSLQGPRLPRGEAALRCGLLQPAADEAVCARRTVMREVTGRRSFFTTLASVAGLAALRPLDAAAQTNPSAGPFDMAWLEQVKGKHKQLYDLGAWSLAEVGRPL